MKPLFFVIAALLLIAVIAGTGCTKVIRIEQDADPSAGIIQMKHAPTPTSDQPLRSSVVEVATEETTPEPTITVRAVPTPTPTIDPRFPTFKVDEEFRVVRDRVSMEKNLSLHATVYGYRQYDKLTWHSYSTGQDYVEYPKDGYVWLFVFVQIYTEDFSGHGEKIWLPNPDHFMLTVDGEQQEKPSDWSPVNLIREIENVYNRNDDSRMKPYDYTITYTRNVGSGKSSCSETVIGNITYYGNCAYTSSGGYSANITGLLVPGKSNAEDGYILWEVPFDWYNHETKVILNFYNFGAPEWILSESK